MGEVHTPHRERHSDLIKSIVSAWAIHAGKVASLGGMWGRIKIHYLYYLFYDKESKLCKVFK